MRSVIVVSHSPNLLVVITQIYSFSFYCWWSWFILTDGRRGQNKSWIWLSSFLGMVGLSVIIPRGVIIFWQTIPILVWIFLDGLDRATAGASVVTGTANRRRYKHFVGIWVICAYLDVLHELIIDWSIINFALIQNIVIGFILNVKLFWLYNRPAHWLIALFQLNHQFSYLFPIMRTPLMF